MANPFDLEAMDPITKALAQARESALSQLGRKQAMDRQATATRQASFNQFGSPILENYQQRQSQDEAQALNQLLGLLAQQEIGARQSQEQLDLQKYAQAVEQFRYDEAKRQYGDQRSQRRRQMIARTIGGAAGAATAFIPGMQPFAPSLSILGAELGQSLG